MGARSSEDASSCQTHTILAHQEKSCLPWRRSQPMSDTWGLEQRRGSVALDGRPVLLVFGVRECEYFGDVAPGFRERRHAAELAHRPLPGVVGCQGRIDIVTVKE